MMEEKDIQEYHNIGRKIKFTNKYNYIQGKQINEHGSRTYDIAGYRLPSVTTILGRTKDQQFLKDWKAKVGEKRAEEIKNYSSRRGTSMHKFLESYVTGIGYDDLTGIGQEAKPMAKKLLRSVLRQLKNGMVVRLCYTILGCMLGLLISFVYITVLKLL